MASREILTDININDIKAYKNNPRKNDKSVEYVIESIKEFGYGNPIIVDENMEVIAGHTRLKAIKKLGWKELPEVVKITGLTEQQKKAYRIADNSSSSGSEWDISLLDIELKDISFDMKKFGLDIPEKIEPNEKDDEVPEAPKIAKTVLGDIIELGNHRLMCGDCTIIDNVDKLMNGQKADMVFTDPPYGVSYADKNKFLNNADKGNRIQTEIENDHLDLEGCKKLWAKAFSNISMILNDYSCYYVTAPQGGDLYLMMMMMMNENGLPLRHTIIWSKNNHVLGRTDYNYKHEPIIYGWAKRHKFYGKGEQRFSVWNFNKPNANKLHPTMKPVELIVNAIMNSTEKDNVVIDIFGGSGSTLIACEKTKRKCYMMELDEKYCDVIIQRYCDYTGNNKIKVNGIDITWETAI